MLCRQLATVSSFGYSDIIFFPCMVSPFLREVSRKPDPVSLSRLEPWVSGWCVVSFTTLRCNSLWPSPATTHMQYWKRYGITTIKSSIYERRDGKHTVHSNDQILTSKTSKGINPPPCGRDSYSLPPWPLPLSERLFLIHCGHFCGGLGRTPFLGALHIAYFLSMWVAQGTESKSSETAVGIEPSHAVTNQGWAFGCTVPPQLSRLLANSWWFVFFHF